ncbi:MAG: response regulator [Methyloceanibacter sp.]|uniref:response regulator n=1 Tax=Methyloceanibacter sp. TaxID=1965321 RepID=UPI003D9BD237
MPRILVVEDEPLISMLMEDWLQELGCEVAGPAITEQAALDYLGNGGLDAAILDIHLGNTDSYALADTLREHGVPIAFSTGDGAPSAPGFEDLPVLHKPFDFDAMKIVVGKLLANP